MPNRHIEARTRDEKFCFPKETVLCRRHESEVQRLPVVSIVSRRFKMNGAC